MANLLSPGRIRVRKREGKAKDVLFAANSSGGGGSFAPTLLMMLLLFGAMYFLFIRPNKRRRQQVEEMQRSIGPGDEVLTIGGLYGVVSEIDDEKVVLEVSPGVRVLDTEDFREEWKPDALAQAEALDVYRSATTDVDWTYVSPAAVLEPGERTGEYRTGDDRLLVDDEGNSAISMEDFAVALLDEAESADHVRRRFTVAS